jgi:hypothetical protein
LLLNHNNFRTGGHLDFPRTVAQTVHRGYHGRRRRKKNKDWLNLKDRTEQVSFLFFTNWWRKKNRAPQYWFLSSKRDDQTRYIQSGAEGTWHLFKKMYLYKIICSFLRQCVQEFRRELNNLSAYNKDFELLQ